MQSNSYYTEDFTSVVRNYDHIYTTTKEGADRVKQLGGSSSVLRQGFDCLRWGSVNPLRGIDVIGFGRQPPSYHAAFQRAFHRADSPILYLHSPIGATDGEAVWTERPMMLKLLQRAKISLAFHLMVEPQGSRPRAASFVTSRWFESLATGCIVAGKRPPGEMAEELFCWENATVDLADSPQKAASMLADLASDAPFLQGARRRNAIEMCRRHDWRYRILQIYQHCGLAIPAKLSSEIAMLGNLATSFGAANDRMAAAASGDSAS